MTQSKYIQCAGEAEANERLCILLGEKFRQYRRQWEEATNCELLTDFPLFLLTETQYTCNLRCIHCVHGHEDLKNKYAYQNEMSFELYRKIIDEASQYHCPSIGLNSTNEPLLTRDLAQRIRYAADSGFMDIMINTNGLLLTENKIEQLIDAGLTRLMVSLDAFTNETYEKIRVGSNFERVIKNIELFLNMRSRKQQQLPLLRISLVRLSFNEHEIDAFIEYWRDRADYVAIQEFASPEPSWDFESFFSGSRTTIDGFSCPQPWQRLVIQGDGSVLPCCSQFSQELKVGNVQEQSIRTMWHSPAMERLRTLHKEERYSDNPVCKKCVSTWTIKH